ncbi:MAG: toll/interleukin-1 receptor domain-containing protein [Actinomycetia bacterium]|nr:toll/interleukin-1 receptor domain-containing protein [Actinomycetes bacterium]
MSYEIFISSVDEDRTIASKVVGKLESENIKCFISSRDSIDGIKTADVINKSKALILILSLYSNSSLQILWEAKKAAGNNIPIIFLKIDKALPSKSLKKYISNNRLLNVSITSQKIYLKNLLLTTQNILSEKSIDEDNPPEVDQPPAGKVSIFKKFKPLKEVIGTIIGAYLLGLLLLSGPSLRRFPQNTFNFLIYSRTINIFTLIGLIVFITLAILHYRKDLLEDIQNIKRILFVGIFFFSLLFTLSYFALNSVPKWEVETNIGIIENVWESDTIAYPGDLVSISISYNNIGKGFSKKYYYWL